MIEYNINFVQLKDDNLKFLPATFICSYILIF